MYQLKQFEEVLQKIAHREAKAAIEKLQKHTSINVSMGKIAHIDTDEVSIDFKSGIWVSGRVETTAGGLSIGELAFTIESKMYSNSNHSTKISFYPSASYPPVKGEEKQAEAKITAFIERIMVGVEPIPRFSLASTLAKNEGKSK